MKVLLTLSALLASSAMAEVTMTAHPNELIISTNKNFNQKTLEGITSKTRTLKRGESKVELVKFQSPISAKAFMSDLEKSDGVNWVAPNYHYTGDAREFMPNDPQYTKQSHHKIIQSEGAWAQDLGSEEIIVAVTDDGFDMYHEDLKDAYAINTDEIPNNGIDDDNNGYVDDVSGWDFAERDNNPDSDRRNGAHGTHVAGIVGATFDNGVGITGFSPKVKVMPIKFYGSGSWTSAMVYESYVYSVDNGAKIITTSYNIDGMSKDETYKRALDYIYDNGVILVNSGGNGNREQSPRTNLKKVILVASTTTKSGRSDRRSSFSNYGWGMDVAAPGDPIWSAGRDDRYMNMSGTSMAAPNMAGLLAYVWSVNPQFTREQVIAKVLNSTDDIDGINSRYKGKLGAGRINAKRAIAPETGLSSVRKAWVDKGVLNIHLKGIINPAGLRSGGIVIMNSKEEVVNFEVAEPYAYGTNVLKVRVQGGSGQYQLMVDGDKISDPFGNGLDADANGVAGGQFNYNFSM